MKTMVIVTGLGLAAMAVPAHAQNAGAAPPACYIEIAKLMADPPVGIDELGKALRELDTALRPQVEHVNQLRLQMARLEQRQAGSAADPNAGIEPVSLLAAPDESTLEEMQKVQVQLNARHAKLKADYSAQQAAIVGPVQARIGQRAQTYAAQQGCREVRMARAGDLSTLAAAGARDLTGEFVTWYAASAGAVAPAAR